MFFIAAQQVSFQEDYYQMGFSNSTFTLSFILEDIASVDDLSDWDDDDWEKWNSNSKKSDRFQNPNNAANIIAQVPFKVPVNSLKRLNIASKLIRYYDSVSIVLSAANIRWMVMNNFEIQRKYMVEKSKETKSDASKLVKNTTVANWKDSVKVRAAQVIGVRKDILEYLLRTKYVVVAPHPPLMMDHIYSPASGSIQGEQNLRISSNHPL